MISGNLRYFLAAQVLHPKLDRQISNFFITFRCFFCSFHARFGLILATLEPPLGQLLVHILNQVDFDDYFYVFQIFDQGLKT